MELFPQKCKTIYEVYFKTFLIFIAETWTLTKRNKSKVQAVNVKLFLIRDEGKTRDSVRD
jgi:hypothetical protein